MMWWSRARWTPIARADDLAPGELRAIEVDGQELVLGRTAAGYFAVQRRCAHRGGDLAAGKLVGDRLICPQHGWRYAVDTGREDGIYGTCLDVFPVRVSGDHVELDASSRGRRRR